LHDSFVTVGAFRNRAWPLTRATVLAACQRQQPIDLGGLRVSFDPRRGSRGYVTQTMLTAGGRVVG